MASILNTAVPASVAKTLAPGWTLSILTGVNKAHRVWRWYRYGKMCEENPAALAGGVALNTLNSFVLKSKLLRISATCVLIAARIVEYKNQQDQLKKAWNNFEKFNKPLKKNLGS